MNDDESGTWDHLKDWEKELQGNFRREQDEASATEIGDATSFRNFDADGEAKGLDSYNWVVPGFMEHQDKLIVTGPSGRGKSTLLRQIAITAAAGRYPVDRCDVSANKIRECEPVTVAYLDCENRESQTWRAFRALRHRLFYQYGQDSLDEAGRNLFIKVREEGIDLLNPINSERLLDFLNGINPGLVIIGPLYYLANGDPNAEQVAAAVARTLRKITTEFGAALIIEAHSAKTPSNDKPRKDPQGANLWIKWPDFGRSIFPVDDNDPGLFEFAKFRGDREIRPEMPDYLRLDWTAQMSRALPWSVDYPNGGAL